MQTDKHNLDSVIQMTQEQYDKIEKVRSKMHSELDALMQSVTNQNTNITNKGKD